MTDWRRIVQGIPSTAVVHETPHVAHVHFAGLELRFQEADDNGWELDEVLGECRLHIEQMSNESYWMMITSTEDPSTSVHLNIGSKSGRAAVHANGWVDT